MKMLFSILMIIVSFNAYSQDVLKVQVSIRDEAIIVKPGDDCMSRIFQINPAQFSNTDVVSINIKTDDVNEEWKRSFFIYDSSDNSIADFQITADKSYSISFEKLKQLLKQNEKYFIYTTAIPKDPQKAMLVKVGRKPVCAIKIL